MKGFLHLCYATVLHARIRYPALGDQNIIELHVELYTYSL